MRVIRWHRATRGLCTLSGPGRSVAWVESSIPGACFVATSWGQRPGPRAPSCQAAGGSRRDRLRAQAAGNRLGHATGNGSAAMLGKFPAGGALVDSDSGMKFDHDLDPPQAGKAPKMGCEFHIAVPGEQWAKG